MKGEKVYAFGEIMMRLSAANGKSIAEGELFDACYGGTEANVLACLSVLGHKTEYLTALPDTGLGEAALAHLKRFGVGTDGIIIGGDTLGLYFAETGRGSRGANVIYYRKNSEIAKLDEHAYDLDKVFDGAALFHISGISFALSESSRRLAFALIDAAKERDIPVSFDFNYRSRLWSLDEARPVLEAAAKKADIVLAATADLNEFLRVRADGFFEKYGACEYLIVRDRTVKNADTHSVRVAAYRKNGDRFDIPEIEFGVKERVGGGDAFDGGVLHAILGDGGLKDAVELGSAAFVLKHSIAGDTFTGTAADVVAMRAKLFGSNN